MQLIGSGDARAAAGRREGKGTPVAISSATDYDPQGDGEEDSATVGLAVDGNPTGTAWSTEHYDSETFAGTKTGPDPGVGLYVTTSRRRRRRRWWSAPRPPAGTPRSSPPQRGTARRLSGGANRSARSSDADETQEIDLNVAGPASTS